MRFEVTIEEIRALLQLAGFDADALELPLEAYSKRREAARQRVPGAVLERYEILLDAGRRPALSAVERGACSGCHVRLPMMLDSQARRSPAIYTCPHCRRLIFAPETLVEEAAHDGADDDEASAASGLGHAREAVKKARRRPLDR